MISDDADLLRVYARERSQEAFAELVRRHLDGVYSAALRRVGGDRALAEDVTQQVFAAMARKAGELARHPMLCGWLYIAGRNEAAKAVRAERRRKAREAEVQSMQENQPEPAHDLAWSRVAPLLDRAIDELSDGDRRAVLLRFVEHRSFAEMAAALRTTEDAARMRVDRALAKLRVVLARRGISSTAVALTEALAANVVMAAPAGLAESVVASTAAGVGAATAAWGLPAAIKFMTTTKALSVSTGVLAVAMLGTLTYEWIELERTETAIRDAKMGYRFEASAHGQWSAVAAQTARALGAMQQRFQHQATDARDPKEIVKRLGLGAGTVEAGRRFMDRHPELKQPVIEHCRANVRRVWEPALRRRNLTAEQIDQMIDFQLTSPMKAMVFNIGGRPIIGPSGETMVLTAPELTSDDRRRQLYQAVSAWGGLEIANEVLTELRPKTNEENLGWNTAGVLAEGLYYTAEPLRADQAEKIASLVSANLRVADLFYDGDAVLEQARAILTPRQFEFMELLNARAVFEAKITRAITTDPAHSPAAAVGGGS